MKESDFIAESARCSGFGHEESTCSLDAAVLAMELQMPEQDLVVEAQAFMVKEIGECSVTIGEGELGKQVVNYITDSAAACNMTPDANGLTNYREYSRPLGLENGGTTSVASYCFCSNNGWVHVKLHNVVHAPLLSYNTSSRFHIWHSKAIRM